MKIKQAIIILLFLMQTVRAEAQQVHIYDQPPSPEEIGRILFEPKTSEVNTSLPSAATRGTAFKKTQKAETPATVTQSNAAKSDRIDFPIKFDLNSFEITSDSKAYLDSVGKVMTSQNFKDKRLIIEGHTDARGSDSYNFYLSERRAYAVSSYLSRNFGINPMRFKVIGSGKSRPMHDRDPYDERNRRVEFYSENSE